MRDAGQWQQPGDEDQHGDQQQHDLGDLGEAWVHRDQIEQERQQVENYPDDDKGYEQRYEDFDHLTWLPRS